jgi:hypothetical protein
MTTSKLHEINTSAQPEEGVRRGRDRMLTNFAVWPAPHDQLVADTPREG